MRRFFSLLTVLALAACGGDSTGPKGTLAGSYSLVTIAGQNLPLVYQDASGKLELLSGSFVIDGTNTFTETIVLRLSDASGNVISPATPVACSGTYTRSGNSLTLIETETDECGGTWTGTWDGRNSVSVNYDGAIAVYRR
jgi:hypothetical protein